MVLEKASKFPKNSKNIAINIPEIFEYFRQD
jgi:hypothetical protein